MLGWISIICTVFAPERITSHIYWETGLLQQNQVRRQWSHSTSKNYALWGKKICSSNFTALFKEGLLPTVDLVIWCVIKTRCIICKAIGSRKSIHFFFACLTKIWIFFNLMQCDWNKFSFQKLYRKVSINFNITLNFFPCKQKLRQQIDE